MHLVDWLPPVPVLDLRLGDVSQRGVKMGLFVQLAAVHEPRAWCIEQAAEGRLLQKVELWMRLDRDQ